MKRKGTEERKSIKLRKVGTYAIPFKHSHTKNFRIVLCTHLWDNIEVRQSNHLHFLFSVIKIISSKQS